MRDLHTESGDGYAQDSLGQHGCKTLGKGAAHTSSFASCGMIADCSKCHAGDRLVTPWLKLLGKGAPDPPMVHIFLKRSGDTLKKAKAEVCLGSPELAL